MLGWAITTFIIAVVAALLGLGGLRGMSADLGWLFAVLAVVLLVATLVGERRSVPPLG